MVTAVFGRCPSWSGRSFSRQRQVFRAGARPAAPPICAFIDAHRDRFGVVPICRALTAHGIAIAPRAHSARRSRPPSQRSVRDAALTEILAGIDEPRLGWAPPAGVPAWQPEDVGLPAAPGYRGSPGRGFPARIVRLVASTSMAASRATLCNRLGRPLTWRRLPAIRAVMRKTGRRMTR